MSKTKNKILIIILVTLILAVVAIPVVKASQVDYNRTTGTLKITKYEQPDGNKTAEGKRLLANVKFQIFKVDNDETKTEIPQKYTNAGAEAIPESEEYVRREGITKADGTVKFDALPIGRYLVHEEEAPINVVQKVANFLIDIPLVSSDGKGVEYDVEVQPKNETVYGSFSLNNQDSNGKKVNGTVYKLQRQGGAGGTTWEDYPDAANSLHTAVDGKVDITGLTLGTYRLVEVSAGAENEGYILDNKKTYNFTVLRDETGATKVIPEELTAVNCKPSVVKKLVTAENDKSNSVNDGDTLTYQLTVDVPESITDLKVFNITDKIADTEVLLYQKGTIKIKGIRTADSGEEELAENKHYTVNEAKPGMTFEVDFVPEQLAAYRGKTIIITYKVTFNAIPDHNDIANVADVTYSNAVKTDADGKPNIPAADQTTTNGGSNGSGDNASSGGKLQIRTGGIKIVKKADNDVTGELLGGAKFKLARTESDAKAGKYIKYWRTGEDVVLVTSSQEDETKGIARFYGLAYGDYYLVEIETPEKDGIKYNKLVEPVLVTVDENSYTTDKIIVNRSGAVLPERGEVSTLTFTIFGVICIIVAIILVKKTKEEKDKKKEK